MFAPAARRVTKLLTVREAAERLRVHPRTVQRAIRAGRLSVVEVARRSPRVSESELERFIVASTRVRGSGRPPEADLAPGPPRRGRLAVPPRIDTEAA